MPPPRCNGLDCIAGNAQIEGFHSEIYQAGYTSALHLPKDRPGLQISSGRNAPRAGASGKLAALGPSAFISALIASRNSRCLKEPSSSFDLGMITSNQGLVAKRSVAGSKEKRFQLWERKGIKI